VNSGTDGVVIEAGGVGVGEGFGEGEGEDGGVEAGSLKNGHIRLYRDQNRL
jgi:hypothetical protein